MEVTSHSSWCLSPWRISQALSQPFLTSINTSLAFIYCNKGGLTLFCLAVAALALHRHTQQPAVSLNSGIPVAAPSVKERLWKQMLPDNVWSHRSCLPARKPQADSSLCFQAPWRPQTSWAESHRRGLGAVFLPHRMRFQTFLWQRTVEALDGDMYQHPPTPASLALLKSFSRLPLREQNTKEGEWPVEEEEQDLSVSLVWVSCCRETFVASCELQCSAKRESRLLKWMWASPSAAMDLLERPIVSV